MKTSTILERLIQAPSSRKPKPIPQSSAISFLSRRSGTSQLWKLDHEQATQLTNLDEMVTDVWHMPHATKSIIGIDHQGNEKQQLLLVDHETGAIEELIFAPEYVHYYGCCSSDGKRVAWTSNRSREDTFDLYIQEIESKQFERIVQFDSICTPIYWFPDEEKVLVSVEVTNIDNELVIVDLEEKSYTKILGHPTFARYQSILVTKDGQGAYLLTDAHADTMGLYYFHFSSHRWEPVVQDPLWEIEQAVLSPDESMIAYTINENGYSSLRVVQMHHLQSNYANVPVDGVIESLSWRSKDELLFAYENPIQPFTLQTYSIVSEQMTPLLQEEVTDVRCIRPELCHFESFDGTKIPYFYYAKQARNSPTIFYIHGGPEAQYRPNYDPGLQYLYQLGYAIAAPNIRGSLGYGRTYLKKDDGKNRLDAIQDIVKLADHLIEQGDANPNQLVIMGHSYGGFSTLLAMTHFPNKWVGGIDIMGMSNLRTFFEHISSWRKKLRQFEYGDLATHTSFFEEIAPLNKIEQMTAPLFIVHSSFDARVPLHESIQLMELMKQNEQSFTYVHFDDEGHFMEKLKNMTTMYDEIGKFLTLHVPIPNE